MTAAASQRAMPAAEEVPRISRSAHAQRGSRARWARRCRGLAP
jgi:hypothetical protein